MRPSSPRLVGGGAPLQFHIFLITKKRTELSNTVPSVFRFIRFSPPDYFSTMAMNWASQPSVSSRSRMQWGTEESKYTLSPSSSS